MGVLDKYLIRYMRNGRENAVCVCSEEESQRAIFYYYRGDELVRLSTGLFPSGKRYVCRLSTEYFFLFFGLAVGA